MKRLIFVFAMAALVACGSKNPMEESVNVEKKEDKLSYAMGVYIGQDIAKMLKMQGQDSIIDKSLLVRGLYDAIL